MQKDLIFDRLCRIADSGVNKELSALVRECKLFLFDKKVAGLTIDNVYDMADAAERISLVMPFDVCAIEVDGASAEINRMVLLVEKFDDSGLMKVAKMKCFHAHKEADRVEEVIFQWDIECTCFINLESLLSNGLNDGKQFETKYKFIDNFKSYVIHNGIEVINANVRDIKSENTNHSIHRIIDVVNMWFRLFILCISTPKNFILEETPKVFEKVSTKNKKALRVHQRPLYTILRPGEIRKKLGLADPTKGKSSGGRAVTPHERRRHERRLLAAGGHFKQDRILIIEATWVGSSEAVVGNKRYKVRLDV